MQVKLISVFSVKKEKGERIRPTTMEAAATLPCGGVQLLPPPVSVTAAGVMMS